MKLKIITITITILIQISLYSDTIYFWHSFRGEEKKAFEYASEIFNLKNESNNLHLKLVEIDPDTFLYKIEHLSNQKEKPDLIIWAHDKIGFWAEKKIILPIDDYVDFRLLSNFITSSINALKYGKEQKKLYGLPLSIECLTLFYNKKFLNEPPKTFNEFLNQAIKFTNITENKYGLVYELDNFYYHCIWLHSYGGQVFDENNKFVLNSNALVQSLKLTYAFLNTYKIVPTVPKGKSWWDLQIELFNNDKALFLISGPWVIGSLKNVNWGISVLPMFDNNTPIMPFLGVKAVYIINKKRDKKELENIMEALKFFTSEQAGIIMGNIGNYIPANVNSYKDEILNDDKIKIVIRDQAMNSVPMPNNIKMSNIWTIMNNKSIDEWGVIKKAQEGKIKFDDVPKIVEKEFYKK